ncbi:MAG TPA: HAMP domain-containing sensor histidine kinase [Thermomicrobiales bacterium]|nr:HAMP domain-containing sensor histidine kinase [Thermomicrobiales bacterium]
MTPARRHWTLPIRRWLALALPVVFFTPVLVTLAVAYAWVQLPQVARFSAADRLREDASRWSDPAWQEATRGEFAGQGVEFVLLEDGRELYRSSADPLAGAGGEQHPGSFVQRVNVTGPGSEKTAYVYADVQPTGASRFWLVPLVGVTTLLATLGMIAWVLGRTVVRPLAAASRAARQVASGNLDVTLPSSRVREVDELTTALETMSAALRASVQRDAEREQERRFFIGAVVHDLRTPLFSLRGYLEGLEGGIADTPEKAAHYVAVAREKANALERLIADLFAFTRLEFLEQTPRREPVDLALLLRHHAESLQPLAKAKGVALTVGGTSEPLPITGDEHLLARAIENLIDNAIRYTLSGGSIDITALSTGNMARFTIHDTGPGIAAEHLPHLFTPLYRGESSRNRQTGGAGLGLTIARRVLLAHGGTLDAANSSAGGAIFTATLPLVDPARLEPMEPTTPVAHHHAASR